MGIEKDGSKGGGHVGGFFHLFDWKVKSRKKLFSSKSEVTEHSKQGKKCEENLPATCVYLMDEDENGIWSSARGNTEYSCASSVTDEEGCVSRGPSVVARLMGLDSVPAAYSSEPYSTPFFDTQSLRHAEYNRRRSVEFSQNYHQMLYSEDLMMKTEDPSRSHVELYPQRIVNRPIEKFRTEKLPPKSAKTIPITQHKLLSPIKCPGFVPSMKAAHIMEVAAKIIESKPQTRAVRGNMLHVQGLSSCTGQLRLRDFQSQGKREGQRGPEREKTVQKLPSGGPSPVPLQVRDLKEKVEAAKKKVSRLSETSLRQADSDSSAMRFLRGHALNKSFNGRAGASSSFRGSVDKEEDSMASKSKGGSISLAIQAKVNVQKKGLTAAERSKSTAKQHEQNENKLSQTFRAQLQLQKNMHKKSSKHNISGALRQSNQKQNCQIDKGKLPSKSLVSNMQSRQVPQKPVSKPARSTKTGSRKLEVLDNDRELSWSNTKNFPRKKRSIQGRLQLEKNKVATDDFSVGKNTKPIHSSSVAQKNFCWAEDSQKKGMDVVSFTFTAPLTRSSTGSESPNLSQSSEDRGKRLLSESDSLKLSSLGYNVLGGDALSKLLEQKLQKLTYEVGSSSSCNASASLDSTSSSTSIFQESEPTPDTITSKPRLNTKREHNVLLDSLSNYENYVNVLGINPPLRKLKHEFQGPDYMEVEPITYAKQSVDSWHPSTVSVLGSESCFSSDSMDVDWTEVSKQSISQAAEILRPSPLRRSRPIEADMELSDSASSLPVDGTVIGKKATACIVSELSNSTEWELEYIKEILSNVELSFKNKNLFLGQSHGIVHPNLFEQLEAERGLIGTDDVDSRLRRKTLFDCVCECMESRCRHFVGGGFQAWELGIAMVRRKESLAEDLHREILGWRGLANCVVDDLVDRDMSIQYKWLDFDMDVFELGVEIGGNIIDSLISEAVSGILQL